MTVTHELTGGHILLLDDEDAHLLDEYAWCPHTTKHNIYASASIWLPTQTTGTVLMHRLVMNAPEGMDVDHINRNGLDNQRSNLQVCTRAQNLARAGAPKTNTSGYKGVSWSKQHSKWVAYIRPDYKKRHLGLFLNKDDAARAYNRAALETWGEFAFLNEVPQRKTD